MKTLFFIIMLALMPTVFKAETPVAKADSAFTFNAAKFDSSVTKHLDPYYKEKDKPKVSKTKKKTRKEQGKAPLMLELGKYAITAALTFLLTCPK